MDSNYAYKLPGNPMERQVILAHVLCGREFDYGQTLDKGLKRPPYIPGTTNIYDSVKVRFMLSLSPCCVFFVVCVWGGGGRWVPGVVARPGERLC